MLDGGRAHNESRQRCGGKPLRDASLLSYLCLGNNVLDFARVKGKHQKQDKGREASCSLALGPRFFELGFR